MHKIEYIFVDSDCQCKPDRPVLPNLGYHFVVTTEALVLATTDISIPVHLIPGPIYDPDKYNKSSICVRFCSSLLPHAWLTAPDASCVALARQRAALLQLLVKLRKSYPDAKILGVSELDGKALHSNNIIVRDAMNILRRELSDL